MGFRFRRSIKILPGVRVNIGNRGISSVTVGRRGASATFGRRGVRSNVGLGGGLSYSDYTPYGNDGYVQERRIGFLLGMGIFVLPVIFSWFTLRQGYGTKSRVIAFLWMFLFSIMSFTDIGKPKQQPTQTTPAKIMPSPPVEAGTIQNEALPVYTKEANPELYRQYGDEGLRAINEHNMNAGVLVASLPECAGIEHIGMIGTTDYPTVINSYVECTNKRFFVSNMQVTKVVDK